MWSLSSIIIKSTKWKPPKTAYVCVRYIWKKENQYWITSKISHVPKYRTPKRGCQWFFKTSFQTRPLANLLTEWRVQCKRFHHNSNETEIIWKITCICFKGSLSSRKAYPHSAEFLCESLQLPVTICSVECITYVHSSFWSRVHFYSHAKEIIRKDRR